MNQLWQYWSGGIPDHLIDEIIQVGESYPAAEAATGYQGETKDKSFRSSEIRWIDPTAPHTKGINELITNFVFDANKNAFGFDVDYKINSLQYTTYRAEDEGKYNWHCDTFWANKSAYDRKLSIVIQLTGGNEYEGGDFLFHPDHEQPDLQAIRKRGSVIVFPSFLYHSVTPVTKGVRKSLVSWIEGPKFR